MFMVLIIILQMVSPARANDIRGRLVEGKIILDNIVAEMNPNQPILGQLEGMGLSRDSVAFYVSRLAQEGLITPSTVNYAKSVVRQLANDSNIKLSDLNKNMILEHTKPVKVAGIALGFSLTAFVITVALSGAGFELLMDYNEHLTEKETQDRKKLETIEKQLEELKAKQAS